MMKLYHNPYSQNARRVLSVLKHLGLQVEEHVIDLAKGQQKAPEFLAINPNGKVPALVDGDFHLWESNAIVQYLAEKAGSPLMPTDLRGRAEIARWSAWTNAHFGPAVATLTWERVFKPMFMKMTTDEAEVKKGLERFHAAAPVLNAHLERRKWLMGDQLTVADFTVAACLTYADAAGVPVADYPHVAHWMARMAELPAWQATQPKFG